MDHAIKALQITILALMIMLNFEYRILFCHASHTSGFINEGEVLIQLKNQIEDDLNALSSWDPANATEFCNGKWKGVNCTGGHVTALDISSCVLGGKIGASVGNLTELVKLDLSNNNFIGAIPTELGQLSQLRSLVLNNNSLSGKFPGALTNLKSLSVLRLQTNQLEGELPEGLGNLTNLTELNLEDNQFRGGIPHTLDRLRSLVVLNLGANLMGGEVSWRNLSALHQLQELTIYSNSFNGTLPDNFSQLSNLRTLNLQNNKFSGSIPTSICSDLRDLTMLQLNNNFLEGGFPSSIGLCSRLETVDIHSNTLNGTIPIDIGNCSNLKQIIAWNNSFFGEIPHEVGNLTRLIDFNFDVNDLYGALPKELGNLRDLRTLQMSLNAFNGTIPQELGQLSSLRFLNLGSSFLTGNIPPELFNTNSSLEEIHLDLNLLTGAIPDTISNASSLKILWLHYNKLSGTIPPAVGNLSALTTLSLGNNSFSGNIPDTLSNLTNLINFDLALNNFTGEIPPFLESFTQLQAIWLHDNKLHGQIPKWLGNLSKLQYLYLGHNSLKGTIPAELGQLTNLTSLGLDACGLTGSIPRSFSQLIKLDFLNLASNSLEGNIAVDFSQFSSPTFSLLLGGNALTGGFPPSLSNCSMDILDLSENQLSGTLQEFELNSRIMAISVFSVRSNNFSGTVPPWIWALQNATILDLSGNGFSGNLSSSTDFSGLQLLQAPNPPDHSTLEKVNPYEHKPVLVFDVEFHVKGGLVTYTYVLSSNTMFDISSNNLWGEIPDGVGDLKGLRVLNFSLNQFSGSIPPTLGSLADLEQMDISHNHLSGSIPSTFAGLNFLGVFDASSNNLSGEIPKENNFNTKFPASAFAGNPELCGSPLELCSFVTQNPTGDSRSSCVGSLCESWAVPVLVTFLILTAITIAGAAYIVVLLRRQRRDPNSDFRTFIARNPYEYQAILNVDFKALAYATNGFQFSEYETLGVGGSSIVYKVVLPETTIALKKISLKQNERLRRVVEFDHEMQTLGTLRHRNLVKLLGFCSNSTMRAIMLEYMENGSLDKHLHDTDSKPLTWTTRLDIAADVAEALYHLHHAAHRAVIHLDLKSSNILLNSDMVAKVGDFGLAKFVKDGGTGEATASKLFGSTGYIPPEYASSVKVSTKGDVYSYGIILLELLTRKRPTDLGPDTTIRQWVLSAFPTNLAEVIDRQLLEESEALSKVHLKQISLMTRLALLCTAPSPHDRPTMIDVKAMIAQIRGGTDFTTANLVKYPSLERLAAEDPKARTIKFNETVNVSLSL